MQSSTFLEILEMGEERGLEEGYRRALSLSRQRLLKQLRLRFGDLDASTIEKVESASDEQLDRWSLQLLVADTVAGVFSEG